LLDLKKLPLSVTLLLRGYNEASVRLLYLLVAESDRWASFSVDQHFLRLLPTLTPRFKYNHVISLSCPLGYKGTVQLHLANLLRLKAPNTILAIDGKFQELRELFLHENID
jgi:hypothetical protein